MRSERVPSALMRRHSGRCLPGNRRCPGAVCRACAIPQKKAARFCAAFSCSGVPDWSRTNGLSLRRRSLYPTELRRRIPIDSVPILRGFVKGSRQKSTIFHGCAAGGGDRQRPVKSVNPHGARGILSSFGTKLPYSRLCAVKRKQHRHKR